MVINPFLLVPPSMLDSLPTKHKLSERHDNVLRQGQPQILSSLLVGPSLLVLTQAKRSPLGTGTRLYDFQRWLSAFCSRDPVHRVHDVRLPETKLARATTAALFNNTKVPAASAMRAKVPRSKRRVSDSTLRA